MTSLAPIHSTSPVFLALEWTPLWLHRRPFTPQVLFFSLWSELHYDFTSVHSLHKSYFCHFGVNSTMTSLAPIHSTSPIFVTLEWTPRWLHRRPFTPQILFFSLWSELHYDFTGAHSLHKSYFCHFGVNSTMTSLALIHSTNPIFLALEWTPLWLH